VLSINKYKEVEREAIEYEPTEVIMARIGQLENEIAAAFNDLKARLQ
jgi:type I restriction enzyme M protein